MTRGIQINFEYPYYSDMVRPKGFLGIDRRYHACWTYFVLCERIRTLAGRGIEDQIIYEGEPWRDKPYAQIAKTTAMRYGLDSPDDYLKTKIIEAVRLEAARQRINRPHDEYMTGMHPGKNIIT